LSVSTDANVNISVKAPSIRRLTLSLLRDLSADNFTSGAALAAKYSVSRSAVSDALKDASVLGVSIFSLTRRGYRLAQPLDFLSLDEIRASLRADVNRVNLSIVDTIESTNTALLQQAQLGAPSGTCLAAEYQTAGRGRRGRVWQSALGASLTFSFLWRSEKGVAALGGLSLVVGLAVANALRELGVPATLKWPNDILVNDKKLGGILIETQGDMLGPTAVVIGIGLNVRLSEAMKAAIDQEVTDIATVLSEAGQEKYMMSRNALLGAALRHLVGQLAPFAETGFAAMRDNWRALHAFEGRVVDIMTSNEKYTATIIDVANDGSLIIDRGAGKMQISAAEISVRLAKK
jgi:BirA family transcriptional regulator, biotin operon repressor / biotin---[acetyl-CoA-carboxylase] ligase